MRDTERKMRPGPGGGAPAVSEYRTYSVDHYPTNPDGPDCCIYCRRWWGPGTPACRSEVEVRMWLRAGGVHVVAVARLHGPPGGDGPSFAQGEVECLGGAGGRLLAAFARGQAPLAVALDCLREVAALAEVMEAVPQP